MIRNEDARKKPDSNAKIGPQSAPKRPDSPPAQQVVVSLMGQPRMNHPRGSHDEAMQMLALLILAWRFLPAAEREDGISRDWLAAMLSPSLFPADPKAAREKVRYLVGLLHGALGIRTHDGKRERGGYKLKFDGMAVDVLEIRRATREGRHLDVVARAAAPLLEGMDYPWLADPFFERVGAALDIWCLNALLAAANTLLTKSETARAKGGTRAGTSREEACDLLDRTGLWLAGRRDLLRRREPAFLREIAQQLTDCRVRAQHPGTDIPEETANLPDPQTSLIGREREIEAALALVRSERLVTLTGPGGLGKTRLALAVAKECQPEYADGVVFVDLSAVMQANTPAQTLALTLGLAGDAKQDWQALLTGFLAEKKLLFLWDNCEQSVDACRTLAEALLPAAPGLHLLITSRERLDPLTLREAVYLVPPLSLPDPADDSLQPTALRSYDALHLFETRAKSVRSQFSLTPENSVVVLQICRTLDGLPLGIELAAALLSQRSVRQIARDLKERISALNGGRKIGTLRHVSLEAAFDLSYARLTPPEKQAFRTLGVFAGSFTLAAARDVLPEHSDSEAEARLACLVRKSLVAEEQRGERWFRQLETVRQYARDRLQDTGEEEEARRRHRQHYFRLAEEAEPHLKGPAPKPWMDRMEAEIANLRLAVEWQTDETAVRLSCALLRFWRSRGYLQEGSRRLMECAGADLPNHIRGRALNGAGILVFALGDFGKAKQLHEESLTLTRQAEDESGIAEALRCVGFVAAHQGDYDYAKTLLEESLRIGRRLGDRDGIARALSYAGMVANYRCEYRAAEAMLEESLQIFRESEDAHGIANCLHNLGIVHQFQMDYPAAHAYFLESMAFWSPLGDRYSTAKALNGLGEVALQSGDFKASEGFYEESLSLRRQISDQYGIANSLNGLGEAALERGDDIRAQGLLEESLRLRRSIGDTPSIPHSLYNLAEVALYREDRPTAHQLFCESLRLMRENDDQYGIAFSLEGLSFASPTRTHTKQAACLLGAASALRAALDAPRPHHTEARYQDRLATVRGRLRKAVFDKIWRAGMKLAWRDAVALALGEQAGEDDAVLVSGISIQVLADKHDDIEQQQDEKGEEGVVEQA